jgi:hypothetical protein
MATLGWLKTIFGLVSNYSGHMTNPVDAENDALTTVGVLCHLFTALLWQTKSNASRKTTSSVVVFSCVLK